MLVAVWRLFAMYRLTMLSNGGGDHLLLRYTSTPSKSDLLEKINSMATELGPDIRRYFPKKTIIGRCYSIGWSLGALLGRRRTLLRLPGLRQPLYLGSNAVIYRRRSYIDARAGKDIYWEDATTRIADRDIEGLQRVLNSLTRVQDRMRCKLGKAYKAPLD